MCPPASRRPCADSDVALRAAGAHVVPDLLDFRVQLFVFAQLALQEPERDARLLLDAARREVVGVENLVLVAAEVGDLDQSALDQRLEAIVGLAEADAERARDLALTELGIGLEDSQQL